MEGCSITNRNINMETKQKELGALWSKTSSKGMNFMSGTIEIDGKKVEVVAFLNTNKKNLREPDWRLFESKPREIAQTENALPTKADDTAPEYPVPLEDSEIPF